MNEASVPITALTGIGIVLALLGLFTSIELVVIGLVAIFAGGALGVLATRRS